MEMFPNIFVVIQVIMERFLLFSLQFTNISFITLTPFSIQLILKLFGFYLVSNTAIKIRNYIISFLKLRELGIHVQKAHIKDSVYYTAH
jgi:hypothetical protein